ncbi:peptidoglycan-binding domain-containing protein [Yinghuangia aomiensis]
MNKPRRTLALILGAVVLVGAGGWYAGQQVQSPAEAAAAHQAPPASLITVPVESRVLTNSVVTHGTISFESPMPVNLSGAVGTASSGGSTGDAEGGPQRVTRAPGVGASVAEGTVFMEVSGRPVFVLRGAVPMYRTLGPGTKGADVKQLNEALKRVGFDPGTSGESFTNGTATALENWYRARGYDAKEPGAEERHRLATLEQAVQAAADALARGAECAADAVRRLAGIDTERRHREQYRQYRQYRRFRRGRREERGRRGKYRRCGGIAAGGCGVAAPAKSPMPRRRCSWPSRI